MKKIYLLVSLFILLILGNDCFSQSKKMFEVDNLKDIVKQHKNIAILPFQVSIKMKKLPKDVTPEMIKEQEKKESKNVQNSVYTYLLNKADNYSVSFQDVSRTNALLAKNNITEDNLAQFTKDELAKMLEVDGIMDGSLETEKPISEGGAIAIRFVFGVGVKTNEANVIVSVFNGSDGKLLWRYDREIGGGLGKSTDDLVAKMMKQIARNFPYEK